MQAPNAANRDTAPVTDRRLPRLIIELVETLVLTLVLFFVIQTFIVQPFQIRQDSMERTLESGQYVLVDKLTPRWDAYKRGDIVVLHPPAGWEDDSGTPFIKRVIGVAGDTVEIRTDGLVYVNGESLDETPYTYRDAANQNEPTTPAEQASWLVPAGQLFVLGDHREASEDSRVFGTITASSVVGRAFVRYWPISSLGILQTPSYP